ncbi:alpha/beta hydrolase [Janibacter sp. CX7]|uniref:alpha/beta hydrolase n=1 Tax=Janibacter sp. CX7 TaxID=2963431 RepID=UPI0020CD56FB|nr:alpha/beta hydrolase [Janibacter sp. CX7]UTT66205.1 alpha/beta hydrolase [Janibacter sp. CX7]
MKPWFPPTVSSVAVAAAAEADNRVHRWPLTPRITRWLRTKGADARLAGFETDRAALGVDVAPDARGDLVMTVAGALAGAPDTTLQNPRVLQSWEGEAGRAEAWVLWVHGGGFCWGSARDGTGLRLAAGLGRPVVSVEYPLAPEARFPVAIEHCLAAYEAGVRERGPRVLLGGVSAGANLALGVLQRIRERRAAGDDLPLPLGVVGLTPFGDLAGEGDSYRVNEGRDAYLRWRGQQERFAWAYAGRADLLDPLVSPVHADWSGETLPPAIFTTGTRDLFLSDTARIHTAWRAAGGEADLVLAEGLWHSYLSDARLPESAALMARLLDWCEELLARKG